MVTRKDEFTKSMSTSFRGKIFRKDLIKVYLGLVGGSVSLDKNKRVVLMMRRLDDL